MPSYKKMMKQLLKPKRTVAQKTAEKKKKLNTPSAAPPKVTYI